jgi:hypothetical protein
MKSATHQDRLRKEIIMNEIKNTYRIKDLVVTMDVGKVMNHAGLCADCNSNSGWGPCGRISQVAVPDRCYGGSEIAIKTEIYTKLTNPAVSMIEKIGTLKSMKQVLQAELNELESMEAVIQQNAVANTPAELEALEESLSGALEEVRAQLNQAK